MRDDAALAEDLTISDLTGSSYLRRCLFLLETKRPKRDDAQRRVDAPEALEPPPPSSRRAARGACSRWRHGPCSRCAARVDLCALPQRPRRGCVAHLSAQAKLSETMARQVTWFTPVTILHALSGRPVCSQAPNMHSAQVGALPEACRFFLNEVGGASQPGCAICSVAPRAVMASGTAGGAWEYQLRAI